MVSDELRASLVWGLVGGLSFLVLVQGYELLTDQGVDALVKVGVALAVFVLSTLLVYWSRRRLRERNERD